MGFTDQQRARMARAQIDKAEGQALAQDHEMSDKEWTAFFASLFLDEMLPRSIQFGQLQNRKFVLDQIDRAARQPAFN